MRMMIRYQNGLRVEAVLLAANSERMRVAIETQCDTIELHRVDAGWCTERGAAIEIEALMAMPGTDLPAFCAAAQRNQDHKTSILVEWRTYYRMLLCEPTDTCADWTDAR
jgi:hypothetical protein